MAKGKFKMGSAKEEKAESKSFEKKDLLTADEFKAIADRVLQKTAARA